VFTLWRQPEVPLRIAEGDWADYRTQVMTGGRRQQGATRIACVDASDPETWVLELLPLEEHEDQRCTPLPGQGVRLTVRRSLAAREGSLLDAVVSAHHWLDGQSSVMSREQLREDPLLSASLEEEFVADEVRRDEPTTRVIAGLELLCDQFTMTAVDTQAAALPAGRMIQSTTREVTAAVHGDIPFLGLAYAAERVRSESQLDPPSSRFRPPPPQVRVEIMELVNFGTGAKAVLPAPD